MIMYQLLAETNYGSDSIGSGGAICCGIVIAILCAIGLATSKPKHYPNAECQRCGDVGYNRRWVELGQTRHWVTDYCACPRGQELKKYYKGK